MRKLKKALAVLVSGIFLMTGLTGCDTKLKQQCTVEEASSTEVLKVGQETVTLDEIYLYMMQCIYVYSLDEKSATEGAAGYKNAIQQEIQNAKAMYQMAIDESTGLEMTDEELEQVNDTVDKYYKTFTEELLSAYGITREKVYQLMLEQRYMTKLQDKASQDMYADFEQEAKKEYGDKRFVDVYYVTFSIDENTTAADKTNLKAQAEELKKKADVSKSLEESAKDLTDVIKDTQRTFVGAYTGDLNHMLETFENNQISDVYEDESGYTVFQMVNNNNTEYRDYFVGAYALQKVQETYETFTKAVLSNDTIAKVEQIGDTWDNLSFEKMAKYMYKNNIYANAANDTTEK